MGWASGSSLLSQTWGVVREFIPEGRRVEVATRLMQLWRHEDCDTLDECVIREWPEMAKAYWKSRGDQVDK